MEPGNSRMSELGSGYSASVQLRLRVNGCVFAASHVSRGEVVLREPTALPDGPAEIIVAVDGTEDRFPVRIDNRDQVRHVVPVTLIRADGSSGA